MNIEVKWSQPLDLVDDPAGIYTVNNLEDAPEAPGVYIYVFARLFGKRAIPIYVGETGQSIRDRLRQHLNTVRLMRGIQKARNGQKVFLFGKVSLKRGQKPKKVRSVLQRVLIERALSDGHELLNKQGTKRPVHTIHSRGNRYSGQIAGRRIFCRK